MLILVVAGPAHHLSKLISVQQILEEAPLHNVWTAARSQAQPWRDELNDLVRALSGGFLFGIPLLHTMEMWWIGAFIEPWRLLVFLGVSFLLNLMLSHFAGFHKDAPLTSTTEEALEAMAIGLVGAAMTLLILGEIRPGVPLNAIVGKTVLESIPFSLGVSIANGLLRGSKEDPKGDDEGAEGSSGQGNRRQTSDESKNKRVLDDTFLDAGATIAGALFIAFSIAPTEEVPMVTGQHGPLQLIVLVFFSLLVSYGITFQAGFRNQQGRRRQTGIFQRPLSETVFSYLLSVLVAVTLLWLFKQVDFGDPLSMWVDQALVLALPATVGGSAGRLAVGG